MFFRFYEEHIFFKICFLLNYYIICFVFRFCSVNVILLLLIFRKKWSIMQHLPEVRKNEKKNIMSNNTGGKTKGIKLWSRINILKLVNSRKIFQHLKFIFLLNHPLKSICVLIRSLLVDRTELSFFKKVCYQEPFQDKVFHRRREVFYILTREVLTFIVLARWSYCIHPY